MFSKKIVSIQEYTLLHWNIWYKQPIKPVVDIIKSLNPDFLLLQELTWNCSYNKGLATGEYIAENLGYYQHIGKAHVWQPQDGRNREALGNGILSRYPIENTFSAFVHDPINNGRYSHDEGRIYLEALVNINGQKFRIGTTHLSYYHKFIQTPGRLKEDKKLINLLKRNNHHKAYPLIFSGDLNTAPSSFIIRQLSKILQHLGPDYCHNTWTTKPFLYNNFEVNNLEWRLDYVFGTDQIQLVKAEIINTEVSDHLPIMIKFKIT
ncbi:MAG: endonuclease/exonuclease/phosphatase family protein [Candidatus Margulisbacteria bacterium]|nr:endonuclease/exonuclease/phosphatase family protein [Candidatus Margulisiibacteriota bacterium]